MSAWWSSAHKPCEALKNHLFGTAGGRKKNAAWTQAVPRRVWAFRFVLGRGFEAAEFLNIVAGGVHRHLVDYFEAVVDVER